MTDAAQQNPQNALTVHEGSAGQPPAPKEAFKSGAKVAAIVPDTFEQVWRLAQLVARSGLAPSSFTTTEQVMVAILHGLEVGFTPMNALQSIAVINGRPVVWGDGAIGLVQKSGQLESIKEFLDYEDTPQMKAVCIVKRKGDADPVRTEFSMIDAGNAGLLAKAAAKGGPWKSYPKRMLRMRARSWALRDKFSDILKGLHVAEEVQDIAHGHHVEHEPALPLAAPARNTVEDLLADLPPDPTEAKAEVAEVVDPATGEITSPEPASMTHTDVAAGAVTGFVTVPGEVIERYDPISSGPIDVPNHIHTGGTGTTASDGFPGDRPMNKPVAEPTGNDIPWAIDRKLTEADREWLRELSEEFGACANLEEVASVAESIMDPAQEIVSTHCWKKACDLMDSHIERVDKHGTPPVPGKPFHG